MTLSDVADWLVIAWVVFALSWAVHRLWTLE
jgi:hypothetical protein